MSDPLSGATVLIFDNMIDLRTHLENLQKLFDYKYSENKNDVPAFYLMRPKIDFGDEPLRNAAERFMNELLEFYNLEDRDIKILEKIKLPKE